jgi:predicted Zn-dependent protease with MMP-like domain
LNIVERERFEWLVSRAVEDLPEQFLDKLQNVDVVVQERPTPYQLSESRLRKGQTLLGLYEGVPLTNRGRGYGLVPPDKITIFQKPIEAISNSDKDIISEVQKVVRHEIAHHFGISDARLRQIEK